MMFPSLGQRCFILALTQNMPSGANLKGLKSDHSVGKWRKTESR